MRIIPAIDVIDGKCVRLARGDYDQVKTYSQDPLEVAKMFESHGLRFLHLVDLDGAREGRVINWKTIEKITTKTNLTIDFGGGLKTDAEIARIFDTGIAQVNLGSIAVNKPDKINEWMEKYGAEKIILSADVRRNKIAINGWQEISPVEVTEFIKGFTTQGLRYFACTDIDRDGMLNGPNTSFYKQMIKEFPSIKLIASGGISSVENLEELAQTGVDAVIIGKAIYENRISIKDLLESQ
jgi:phosphoribosylformimino-5-aminoimidazole carboxamide ribotide isomerase